MDLQDKPKPGRVAQEDPPMVKLANKIGRIMSKLQGSLLSIQVGLTFSYAVRGIYKDCTRGGHVKPTEQGCTS